MPLPNPCDTDSPFCPAASRKRAAPRQCRPEQYSGGDAEAAAARAAASFFERVYALVAGIPKGKVMTYGQIAMLLDNVCSARYVGFAMSAVPEKANLPCHRVVNREGEMAPGDIFGGEERQRELLRSEGVVFGKNGRVDMRISLFRLP